MITPSNPVPPSEAQKAVIRIPATEVIPRVQPAIAVGEVLRMVVRNNNQGQGQLYFRGLLIPAALPENLAAGDKIFAKVTQADNQLVLKLLETQRSPEAEEPGQRGPLAQPPIIKEFESLVKGAGVSLLKGSGPVPLPTNAQGASTPRGVDLLARAMNELSESIGSADVLADANQAHAQLVDAATGKVALSLRETADRIRTLLGEPATPPSRMLSSIRDDLSKLVESSISDNQSSTRQLETLIKSLTQELRPERRASPRERDLLTATLKELVLAKETPDSRAPRVEATIRKLHHAFDQFSKPPLDPQTASELQQIAARLEQLASSQEHLMQLNPVMQALGEPALILFPFLAQGLLTQSEVSIESRMDGKSQGGGRQTDEESESGDTTPYQRIQVSVPLPAFGDVHVDIAHRRDEILVRFSVLDPEAEKFLLEQLEHLGTTLRSLSFKRMELMTHVGRRDDLTPAWVLAASGTTVIA